MAFYAEESEYTKKIKNQLKELNGYYKGKMPDPPKRKFTWGQSMKYEVNPQEVISKTASLPKSCTDPSVKGSPIQEFYNGAHVLVTGATGFMGKILVEKLLVSCPKLDKLYLVIREKKGQSMEDRFDVLFKEPIFSRLHKTVPDFRKKLVPVNGDCSQLRLGLSEEAYNQLIDNVTVIIHGAATVRFDEKLRIATHINVRGVREILNFSRKCHNLKSVIHISTAYSNCLENKPIIEEQFYPPIHDYKNFIEMVDNETDDKLDEMTEDVIQPWPNTYAFTKQMAEEVVRKEGVGLPIAIYRPAMVIASAKEPIRSWSDNIYGPTGVIIGAGTGVLRVMHAGTDNQANIVPVDMAVNGVIAAAWKAEQDFNSKKDVLIYNYVSTTRNPVSWEEFANWNGLYGRKWPTVKAVWYPMLFLVKNRFLYLILNFLIHTLPAYIADGFLFMTGQPTQLIKGYQKISKFLKVVAYFSTREWYFTDDNVVKLWNSLSLQDKEIYPFDIAELDWDYYSHTHLLGLRVHIVKDNVDTIEAGRIKNRRLLLQHIVVLGLVALLFLWTLSKIIGWSFL